MLSTKSVYRNLECGGARCGLGVSVSGAGEGFCGLVMKGEKKPDIFLVALLLLFQKLLESLGLVISTSMSSSRNLLSRKPPATAVLEAERMRSGAEYCWGQPYLTREGPSLAP
tara:strand:+ start:10967 stop:11305 length:339 start_codon:yes stop_codon:yes gene_type:complete